MKEYDPLSQHWAFGLIDNNWIHTRSHFCFGNYSLPLLTAEGFLHLDKGMEGSMEIKGEGVVIVCLPFICLCTPRAVQLCIVPNKGPEAERQINTD